MLGFMYDKGQYVEKDLKKAFELYSQSASMGNSTAINNLGYMYQHGEYVKKDLKKVFELCSQSASMGNSTAINHLDDFNLLQPYLERYRDNKLLKKEIQEKNKEIERLELIIEELELRPPNVGGKLYVESKKHFDELK
tara:strand:- start:122 stop:535 length:414 start_codon:yes stop_codon:yes gene_type:complete